MTGSDLGLLGRLLEPGRNVHTTWLISWAVGSAAFALAIVEAIHGMYAGALLDGGIVILLVLMMQVQRSTVRQLLQANEQLMHANAQLMDKIAEERKVLGFINGGSRSIG